MVVCLRIGLRELIGGSQQNGTCDKQACAIRQNICFDQKERGHNHVIKIIKDVIKQCAVNSAGIFFHICPTCQHAIETIHEHGDDHVNDHHAPVVLKNGKQPEESPHCAS